MDHRLLAIISVRSLAMLFALQGYQRQAESLNLLATGLEAGVDVDDHMRGVAAALAESDGTVSADMWDDVHARITADSEESWDRGNRLIGDPSDSLGDELP